MDTKTKRARFIEPGDMVRCVRGDKLVDRIEIAERGLWIHFDDGDKTFAFDHTEFEIVLPDSEQTPEGETQ